MKLCVMISGSGTNLQTIIDATQDGRLTSRVALVVSNRKAAYGLERARQANIPTRYFPLKPYPDRPTYEADLAAAIKRFQPDLLVLAGWMHVFSPLFLNAFPNQVINLHPALPGTFPGMHGIQRAYTAFQNGEITHSGCMIHRVIPEVDAGEVLIQAEVPFQPNDTLEAFTERMRQTEHHIFIEALQNLEKEAK
jgi:formyltetrahydrofolate-dependent phosphoribosylglycinamide formyltransferase